MHYMPYIHPQCHGTFGTVALRIFPSGHAPRYHPKEGLPHLFKNQRELVTSSRTFVRWVPVAAVNHYGFVHGGYPLVMSK